jgi:hypothetical protein
VLPVVGFHLALGLALCLGVFLLRFLLLSDHLLVSLCLAIGIDVSGGRGKTHAQPQESKQDDQDALHTVSTQLIAMILPQICRRLPNLLVRDLQGGEGNCNRAKGE